MRTQNLNKFGTSVYCIFHYTTRDACVLPARRYASAGIARCSCLSVCLCLSQVGVLSKRFNELGWFLARELSSTYRIHVPSKNESTSLWNFAPKSKKKFRHNISIVEACYQLSSERWQRSESDKLGRRRSTKLIIPPSSDARPL